VPRLKRTQIKCKKTRGQREGEKKAVQILGRKAGIFRGRIARKKRKKRSVFEKKNKSKGNDIGKYAARKGSKTEQRRRGGDEERGIPIKTTKKKTGAVTGGKAGIMAAERGNKEVNTVKKTFRGETKTKA